MDEFENIRRWCREHGISIQELAEKANVSASTIYGWKYKKPSIKNLNKVSKAMHVTTGYVIDNKVHEKRELNDTSAIFTFNGEKIPEEDMKYVRELLKRFSGKKHD
ncbi:MULTISPECIES: helix-turn-helix domain-containing protein [Lactobacillus]|uniref:Helix-turn-helix domain-containing protein n=2 Tax=Lactobacillus TaxID=1578 RepID=A0AAW5WZB9_9LACO|nr:MULTISPECIES: helix-turn-helix transcriptional regulator [Lactobacillus]DAS59720.1 MAG TPA: repressor protein [Caudoviricetes sp.]EEX26697.1 DNA-binding helix-turn-helix protein [Lactobacillus jensenii SJ-7A-US]KAA9322981.1 helix-turn-helix transcriptional regulator [Lactobacillus jensenii]KAA9369465.1 helix-turn-helix transcriptional regulator [Lactobacillus jensenii]MBS5831798.1 helix-turn-helix transcriptional regulator [Lactobacillus jensenii]